MPPTPDAATPAPAINPRQIKHIRVIVGDTDYAAQVNKCEFKKSGGAVQTWQGGTPGAQYVDKAASEHSVDLGLIADWEQEDSFCNYLYENDGEKATLQYMPAADGLVYFESEITIDAPPPPGAVGSWAETTATMPCTKPVRKRLTAPVPDPEPEPEG